MKNDPLGVRSGLILPPGIVQPFFLRFRRDDLHVMAFFVGHPEYEAVEAMIQNRTNGEASIRAILTRHNQSQIDHINDAALAAQMRGAHREVCDRSIAFETQDRNGKPRARIEFQSLTGEHVVLDVTAVRRADAAGRGLTDPGGHSATSSLPIMWRAACTLAGPETQVIINGVRYGVPVKIRSGPFIAHEGYFTEGHSMGVFRAGTVTCKLLKKPDRFDLGSEWLFESVGQEVGHRAMARANDGQLHIVKLDGSGETITGRARDDGLEVTEIRLPADPGSPGGLALTFDGAGGFSVSIEDAEGLVSGRAEVVESLNHSLISLYPSQPSWALDRVVRVACSRDGDNFTFATTIGARH
ncbi:MAG: hypothetical protein ACLQAT_02090 [Candidatus Binataceae bacterium]